MLLPQPTFPVLLLRAGDWSFAVDVRRVVGLMPLGPLEPPSGRRPGLLGYALHAGAPLAVLDLAPWFDAGAGGRPPAPGNASGRGRVAVLRLPQGARVGLRVQGTGQVVSLAAADCAPDPLAAADGSAWSLGQCRALGQWHALLDVRALSSVLAGRQPP